MVTIQMPLHEFQSMKQEVGAYKRLINHYKAWGEARSMVIEYLTEHGHIIEPTEWAHKTIELLKELDEIKSTNGQHA